MARASRPGPVQAIVGEDTYLAEESLERVLAAAVGDDRQDAVQVFHGDEKKWAEVLGAARTGSLFVARRAVVVRRADQFAEDRPRKDDGDAEGDAVEPRTRSRGAAAKAKAAPREHPLVEYVAAPSPDVTLVLVAARPDARRNPWKKVLPAVDVHDAKPLKGRFLRAHVEQELRARGLRFAPDALQELLGEVGQDLRRLMGEVDKLEAFAGERRAITADDVSAVLGRGLSQPLYLLSDAFAGRDAGRSLELLERLLADREEPVKIHSALHRSLRQVRAARAMLEARVPRAEIGAKLLPPHVQFKLEDLLKAARRWSEGDLRRGIAALGEADRRLKTGADGATALVVAVAESCGSGVARAARRATWPRRGR
jgi:DNA polymerase-3 subunit delta